MSKIKEKEKNNSADLEINQNVEKPENIEKEIQTEKIESKNTTSVAEVLAIQKKIDNLPEPEKKEETENIEKRPRAKKIKIDLADFDTSVLIMMFFNLLAKYKGDHWNSDKENLKLFADHTNQIVNKYLNNTKFVDIYIWGFELALMISVNLKIDFDIKKEKALENKNK